MIRRLSAQLPIWARTTHPVLRYELGKVRPPSQRARFGRALVVVLVALLLGGGGYLIATGLLTHPAGTSLTETVNAIVFWPLLVIQFIARIAALTLTSNAVSDEVRRQNWDNLRATSLGAELALRARWASVFYRLRGILGIILLLRVILIFGILYDLTAFQGRYLDLLINGILPEVPLVAGVLLLSLLMTASLLLPITGVGFDAALGLLLSTLIRQRTYSALVQLLFILVRFAIVAGLLLAVARFMNGEMQLPDSTAWLLVAGFAALGDWGLAFLNLGVYGEIWATVPYGILLGLALLVFAMLQAIVTDQILVFAVRRAERKG
jgi:hypothetical protein